MHLDMDQRAYVKRETIAGTLIAATLSGLACIVVLGRTERVLLRDLQSDSLPHSFMLTFLAIIVPSLITWHRVASGRMHTVRVEHLPLLRRHLLIGALAAGSVAMVVGYAFHALILPLVAPVEWPFAGVVVFKVLYGAAIALAISPWVVRSALTARDDGT